MFALRSSRLTLTRCLRQSTLRRTFVAAPIRLADPVQDLYLKELKAYKPPAVKASDSEGQVKVFKKPTAPTPPADLTPESLAVQLEEYNTQEVEVEGQAEGGAAVDAESDWFEDDVEEEEVAHH